MKIFDLIPPWAYWIVIGALSIFVGVQQMRVSGLKVDLAEEKQSRSEENTERIRVALQWQQYIDGLRTEHATAQQLKEDEYAKQSKKLQADRLAALAANERLRGDIAAFVAGDRRPGESDAVAYQRAADRLKILGTLLAGGADLVTNSLEIIERRDLEVKRLFDQIHIDRAACSAGFSPN